MVWAFGIGLAMSMTGVEMNKRKASDRARVPTMGEVGLSMLSTKRTRLMNQGFTMCTGCADPFRYPPAVRQHSEQPRSFDGTTLDEVFQYQRSTFPGETALKDESARAL